MSVLEKAIRLSPIYPAWFLNVLSICYYLMDERDLAKEKLQESISKEPDAAWGRLVLISILIDTGSMEDAEQLVRDVMRLEHNFSVTRWSGIRFKDEQFRKKMIDNLIKAGLPE